MKKLLNLLPAIISLYCFFFHATPVMAISEFTTTFNSLYTISSDGTTNVTHTIILKNNLAHIYATNYTIATSGDKLTNITTMDESGPISSSTSIQNGITTIQLFINRPSIGKDQEKTITISYQTDDVVEIIGDTTTINIPRLARANEAESYTRVVKVAGVENRPQFIYPAPSKTEPDGDYAAYTFSGHQSESLTLLFGKSVTYKINLTYELKNKELSATDSELALPPDTGYQHIVLTNLDPPPLNIRVDESGNWLARYKISPQEKFMVKAELYATIYPQPNLFDPSETNLVKTARSKYWDTTSTTITTLGDKLKTPENIYHYLTDNFTYNYAGVSTGGARKGALAAISSPSNVLCTEFTDSFVSLARSQSIPSREINGYGYTKNATLQPQSATTDILHAWPEYYDPDKKTWISVDPTWGNTTGGIDYFNKLDFSHITFVRHGLEDSYPLPAGSYKSNPSDKHIQVELASVLPTETSTSENRDGIIYNTGNVAIIDDTVGYLPPYGSFTVPVSKELTLYDKIRLLCAKLLSKFWQRQPAST